jgi:hypothetical protein
MVAIIHGKATGVMSREQTEKAPWIVVVGQEQVGQFLGYAFRHCMSLDAWSVPNCSGRLWSLEF